MSRGTTTERGLGWDHQKRRDVLIAKALGTPCPDCGTVMTDRSQMVADHSKPRATNPTSVADRVHCRPCSDKQGGRTTTNARRHRPSPPHPGRI